MNSNFDLRLDYGSRCETLCGSDTNSKLANKDIRENFVNKKNKRRNPNEVAIKDLKQSDMEIEINGDEKIQLTEDSYSMINKEQLQKAIDGYSNSVKNFAKYDELDDDITTSVHPEMERKVIDEAINKINTLNEEE